MIADRKDDHVRLAAEQQHRHFGYNQFDDVSFIHHALAGIDRSDVSLATRFAGIEWQVPLYINAMTGGSVKTGAINRDLAIAARETGVPIATGSMSAYFADESVAGTFSVMRRENPDGFIMANINATTSVEKARRAIDLLRADALQIHLNTIQETVMPEGDRSFSSWGPQIERIVTKVDVPVIVKEVGFGLSRETMLMLQDMGVQVADVAGNGGTNFARIENGRRDHADYSYLDDWGQSAPACLLDAHGVTIPVLASGGVRNPLDVARGLALGAVAVGASGGFLKAVLDGGAPALVTRISAWLDQLAALMTALGARTPAELARCDVLIHGALRSFCADRGIDTRRLATRSSYLGLPRRHLQDNGKHTMNIHSDTVGQPTSDRILQLINGYWATGILGAAASHSLFTHLQAGADTAKLLAARAGISRRGAQTLLDGLVSLGLVELRDGGYRNSTEAAAFLVDGQPGSLTGFAKLKLNHMVTLAGLPEVVRAGGPVTNAVVEVADNPHWEELVQALAAQSVPVAKIAADTLRLAEAGEISILDIGGGSGVYSAIWLELNPAARSTQLDWRPINAIARRLIAERGVADRFACIDGDFHTTSLGTAAYDIAVYSHIAHQEGPEDNIAIFSQIRDALKPGGTLVVCDYIVDDDRSGPPFPLTFAAEMLIKSKHGGTWRRADYQDWLTKAGFEDISFQTTPSPATLVFAR